MLPLVALFSAGSFSKVEATALVKVSTVMWWTLSIIFDERPVERPDIALWSKSESTVYVYKSMRNGLRETFVYVYTLHQDSVDVAVVTS